MTKEVTNTNEEHLSYMLFGDIVADLKVAPGLLVTVESLPYDSSSSQIGELVNKELIIVKHQLSSGVHTRCTYCDKEMADSGYVPGLLSKVDGDKGEILCSRTLIRRTCRDLLAAADQLSLFVLQDCGHAMPLKLNGISRVERAKRMFIKFAGSLRG